MTYAPGLPRLRSTIDAELTRFLGERRERVPEAVPLIDEIARLLRSGGKRLRPCFCYWGYRAFGRREDPPVVRAAGALELLHSFAIVHDDIMDDSRSRRGEPTTHVLFDVSFALLVGDFALVLADEAFMRSGFEPDVILRAFEAYSRMRQEVIAGQYLDLAVAGRADVGEEDARRIAVLKSGRYSVEEPLLIGALLAGAPERAAAALNDFGRPLGEAFQLRDDLLGTFGDARTIGKPVDSDIREGKRNLLYAKTFTRLAGSDKAFFAERWGGSNLSVEEVDRLRSLVASSGAQQDVEVLLKQLTATAEEALARLEIETDARAALEDLTREATTREN